MPEPERTLEQIIEDANALARALYLSMGYQVPDDYKFHAATHPQAVGCWNMAAIAYEHIESTDIEDCLAEWLDRNN